MTGPTAFPNDPALAFALSVANDPMLRYGQPGGPTDKLFGLPPIPPTPAHAAVPTGAGGSFAGTPDTPKASGEDGGGGGGNPAGGEGGNSPSGGSSGGKSGSSSGSGIGGVGVGGHNSGLGTAGGIVGGMLGGPIAGIAGQTIGNAISSANTTANQGLAPSLGNISVGLGNTTTVSAINGLLGKMGIGTPDNPAVAATQNNNDIDASIDSISKNGIDATVSATNAAADANPDSAGATGGSGNPSGGSTNGGQGGNPGNDPTGGYAPGGRINYNPTSGAGPHANGSVSGRPFTNIAKGIRAYGLGFASGGQAGIGSSGLVQGRTGGRADEIPAHIPEGSYIMPADVVSALGQGNTLAGGHKLDRWTGGFPKGGGYPSGYASGGMVDVRLSDGEYHIPPHVVTALGHGNPELGAKMLDHHVRAVRQATIKKLKGLPAPK